MEKFDDKQILDGILINDAMVLQYIYKKYYYLVNRLVLNSGGNDDDCDDIFQDAIIIIYRKLKDGNLKLYDFSFETYLLTVCRFCLLKNKSIKVKTNIDDLDESINKELLLDLEVIKLRNEKYRIYTKYFDKLNKDEKKILRLSLDNTSEIEIMKLMGFLGIDELNTAFAKAKEHLKELIKNDDETLKQIDKKLEQYIDNIDNN
jgi:RNA polymerase sigma factor (sigma-70 family)